MEYTIKSEKAYHDTMIAVYELIERGEATLSADELKKLKAMSLAAEQYEHTML